MADDQRQQFLTIAASLIIIIAVVFILKTLKGIFIPLVIAIFVTYLFAPVVEFLAKYKVPRIASLFIMLIIVGFIGVFLTQIIIGNVRDFIAYWPSLEKVFLIKIGNFLNKYAGINTTSLSNLIKNARIQEFLSNIFNLSFSIIGQFLLTMLLLVFIYLSYHNYPKLIRKAFDEERANQVFNVLNNINVQIVRYIFTKTLISAGTGILTGIGCRLLGIKFAVLWGLLAFLLNYIPYIGSLIAIILPISLSFLQFPHSIIPYLTILVLIAIQMIIGSFLDPEIMGNRFNLSPIVILISLFFWGYVWGMVGTFLAVPITAIIKIVIQNIPSLRFIAVLMSKKVE